MYLEYVLVFDHVVALHDLPVELARAPDLRELQLVRELPVDLERDVLDRAPTLDHERLVHVGVLARYLAVDPHNVQELVENLLHLVETLSGLCGDGQDLQIVLHHLSEELEILLGPGVVHLVRHDERGLDVPGKLHVGRVVDR